MNKASVGAVEAARKWLLNEAEAKLAQAAGRRDSGKDRNATVAELKQARRLAEGMAGRKLAESSIDPKVHAEYCDMQVRIADSLEIEVKHLELAAQIIESSTQVSELRRVLKLANDFIVNGVEYQAGHYEAETVHHEIWAVLEGKG